MFLGLAFWPVTSRLFSGFRDRGWLFSKALGVGISGYVVWALVGTGLLPFTRGTCIGTTVVLAVAILLWHRFGKGNDLPAEEASWIFAQELLFFLIFLLWTYFAGFRPQAYGTEKFMDYGFMEAMMRSDVLPAEDLWYAGAPLNYYYGGQYFAVFLTKLTFTRVEETYNLMRTLVAAFSFSLPCALCAQLLWDRGRGEQAAGRMKKMVPILGGLLAGGAVSLAGNMHYVIYAKLLPLLQRAGLWPGEPEKYWFPDATRYIGHRPDVPDKTIHEFPSYSFILGDLHAHVVNLMFVLLLLGLLYAWHKRCKESGAVPFGRAAAFWKQELLAPELLVAAWLLGMFQWTNYWDFVIYYVVTGGVVFFTNLLRFDQRPIRAVAVTAGQAVEVTAVVFLAAWPFTRTFETMVQGVALCQNHSRLYQLLVLWGLPAVVTVSFLALLFYKKKKDGTKKKPLQLPAGDVFILVLSLCALGLVLLPEIVYVRDIYENGSARANTMFKLTYQAFLLFGIVMSYSIFSFLAFCRKRASKVWGVLCLLVLLSTFGYLGNGVHAWFGDVWKPADYQGLDATRFLETDFPQDVQAIRWLKENIDGHPVVLEANGDSYSEYERVSAMTGLPTVLGWYVHEWLWRNDTEDLNIRSGEVEEIYTSQDAARVRELLEKYKVEYIFVGKREQEKYADLATDGLKALGEVVFQDAVYQTFIVKVGKIV